MGLSDFFLTDAGNRLLARAQLGEQLTITRAQVGEGTWPEGTTHANIKQLAAPVKFMAITDKVESSGQVKITVQFNNSGINREFLWSEFALWAADPEYPDDRSRDILYGTAYADGTPVPIDSILTEFLFNVLLKTGTAQCVTVVVDSSLVYVTRKEFYQTIGQLSLDMGYFPEPQTDVMEHNALDDAHPGLIVDGNTDEVPEIPPGYTLAEHAVDRYAHTNMIVDGNEH